MTRHLGLPMHAGKSGFHLSRTPETRRGRRQPNGDSTGFDIPAMGITADKAKALLGEE